MSDVKLPAKLLSFESGVSKSTGNPWRNATLLVGSVVAKFRLAQDAVEPQAVPGEALDGDVFLRIGVYDGDANVNFVRFEPKGRAA